MESAGHKRIVLYGIAEYHQLGAAEASLIGGFPGQVLDGPAHEGHRVHIDTCLGGAYIDAAADNIGGGQGLGNGADENTVCLCHAFLDQSGETADEVDPGGFGGPVHGLGKGDIAVGFCRRRDQGDGGDGDALVDNGNAKLFFNGLTGGDQIFGILGDLVIYLGAGGG